MFLRQFKRGFHNYYSKRNNECDVQKCDTSPFPKEEIKKSGCMVHYSKEAKPITHAIIDLDGVILDAIKYNLESHEEYLMKWRKNLKLHTRYNIMSMRNQDAGQILTSEFQLPFNGKVYAHGVWQMQRYKYRKAKIVKGIDNLICHFVKHKVPLAMISSSNSKGFQILYNNFKKTGLHKFFCHYVHGDHVKEGKPSPEMLCAAVKKFPICPDDYSKFLVIDSGVCGAQAAKEAGMQSVLVTDQCIPREMMKLPNVTLFNIKDFDPLDFGLPPITK